MRRLWILAAVGVLGAGCAGQAPVPEQNYYRLQLSLAQAPAATPLLSGTLEVKLVRADGVRGERAMLYSSDPGHRLLRQYHYHYWSDSPSRVVQEQLIAYLRAARLADAVTRDESAGVADYAVTGTLTRFEQLVDANASRAVVGIDLTLERTGARRPMLVKDYEATATVDSAAPERAVEAYEAAMKQIFDAFVQDVRRAVGHAGPVT